MKILFAAGEKTRGGFLSMLRSRLPKHRIEAAGRFEIDTLAVSTPGLDEGNRMRPGGAPGFQGVK